MKGFFQNIVSNDEFYKKENLELKNKLLSLEEENRLLKNCCLPKSKFSKSVTSEEPFDNKFDQIISESKMSSKYIGENGSLKEFKNFLYKNLIFTNNITSNDIDCINNLFIKDNDWENNKSVFLLKQNIIERNMLRMVELLALEKSDDFNRSYYESINQSDLSNNQNSLKEKDFEVWMNKYCKNTSIINNSEYKNQPVTSEEKFEVEKIENFKQNITIKNPINSANTTNNINKSINNFKQNDNKLNKLLYFSEEEEDNVIPNTKNSELNTKIVNKVNDINESKKNISSNINNFNLNKDIKTEEIKSRTNENIIGKNTNDENSLKKQIYEWDIDDEL